MTNLHFPTGFLFGTATSAHQIEGNNIHSDWWQWEQEGNVAQKSSQACDSWHRWQEDIDLAYKLGTNAYRFSIEWARIEPEEGKFDPDALRHYEEQIKYLHKLGMKAMLTLWHFSSPQWFTLKGGFAKGGNNSYFLRFVQYVLSNLKNFPDYWITFNEINTVFQWSFWEGYWPPGKIGQLRLLEAYRNFFQAHKEAYKLIHRHIPDSKVSTATHYLYIEVPDGDPLLRLIGRILDIFTSKIFFVPLLKYLDFLGINYYVVHRLHWKRLIPKSITPERVEKMLDGQRSDLGWPIYPHGLYKLLLGLKKYRLPIIITENGIADKSDAKRGQFIFDHLHSISRAIAEGVDVQGYFYWSLMDNFEWALGYKPKFGLFETDFKTFTRTPRPSAKTYTDICRLPPLT